MKLGEIGDWQSGSTPSRSNKDYFNGNILWLKTGDLKDNYIYEIPEKITEKALIETSLKVNPIGSVLIAMYGATIGKVGILTQPATTNQACCACSNFKGISNLYLFYLLIAYRDYFIQLGEGGAQPNISKIKITSTYIPLPPLAEQHRIVYEIERLFELVDTVEENKLSLEQFIAQTKSKVLDLAIRGKLVPQDSSDEPASVLLERIRNEQKFKKTTSDKFPYPFEVPSGWIWANGFTCFNPMENKKPVGDYFNYIDIEAIDNEKHVIKESRKLKVSEAPSRASRLINKGDTLFSMVRPYLENIAYVDRKHDKCIASTGFYVCKPNKLLYPRYLYFLMLSNYVINGLNSFMKGDNSPSINNTNITTFLYPIPPLSEQLRIVEKIEEIFKMLDKMQVNLQANT